MDTLPPFRQAALFLDMDGTLIDIAPTPDAVVVEAALPGTLASLRDQMGGALAIVTGRPVETVDRLFGDAPGAVAGEHGGAFRFTPGAPLERPDLPTPPQDWLAAAERLVAAFPGTLLERKARGFALHFRLAPEAEPAFRAGLTEMLGGCFRLPDAARTYAVGGPAPGCRQRRCGAGADGTCALHGTATGVHR